jgi:hypothetical protein
VIVLKKVLSIILIVFVILILPINPLINAAPGDNNDPIVVLSYLNLRFNELVEKYGLNKIAEHEKTITELNEKLKNVGTGTGDSALEVVEIKTGESLIAGAGTEIILRSGKVNAIASSLGGLSDVTKAGDIKHGVAVESNHLLIIPRNDGRGVLAVTDAILLVRGEYKVVK